MYNPVTRWLNQVQYLRWQSPDGVMFADPSQMNAQSSQLSSNVDPVAQASSVSANALNYYMTTFSGTAAMALISVPTGFRGTVALRPTAAFTGVTGGTYASNGVRDTIPIGLAFTAVIGKILFMTTDGLLWYPSY